VPAAQPESSLEARTMGAQFCTGRRQRLEDPKRKTADIPVLAASPSEKIGIDSGEWRFVIAACEIMPRYVQNEI